MKLENYCYLVKTGKLNANFKKVINKIIRQENLFDKNGKTDFFITDQLKDEELCYLYKFDSNLKTALNKNKIFLFKLNKSSLENEIEKGIKESFLLNKQKLNDLLIKYNQLQQRFKNKLLDAFDNLIQKLSSLNIELPTQKHWILNNSRKNLELLVSATDFSKFPESEKTESFLRDILKVIKKIIFEYSRLTDKNKKFDDVYLIISKNNGYSVVLSKYYEKIRKDKSIPNIETDNFSKIVNMDAGKITGQLDGMSSLFEYLDFNKLLNKPFFDEGNIDIFRHCFVRFSISDQIFYKTASSSKNALEIANNLKHYFNLYCSKIAYYRSYSINALKSDLIQNDNKNIQHISVINKEQKEQQIIKNLENNESINFFISKTTSIYAVSECFILNSNVYPDKEKLDFTRRNHEFRYSAKQNSDKIVTSIIYYSLCLQDHLNLQNEIEKISNHNSFFRRLFKIHSMQKLLSNTENSFKTDAIFVKQESQFLSNFVKNNFNVKESENYTDHMTSHLWYEASTTNGKFSLLLQILEITLSIISAILLSALSIICFKETKTFSFNDINNIAISIALLTSLLLLLLITVIKKIKK